MSKREAKIEYARAYTELVAAILRWDEANKNGVRADVTNAEKILRSYAEALRENGWKMLFKGENDGAS